MSGSAAATKCAAGTLRRASRSVSRAYDAWLAPTGLSATQFSLLRAIERHGAPMRLAALAEELVFERTSLYRALQPLERDGLVSLKGAGGRAKVVSLSSKGARRIAQALPLWNAAQEEFLERFGRAAWNEVSAQLVGIAELARGMPAGNG